MILSDSLKTSKNGKFINTQVIIVKCDECEFIFSSSLSNEIKGLNKYAKDLCRSCKQKEQYKLGLRNKQKHHIANYATTVQKGKTYEVMYSSEKSNIIKEKLSRASSEHNPRWSLKHRTQNEIDNAKKELGCRITKTRKGKTYEEIYGEKLASDIKKKLSYSLTGIKNHMYGKPPPKGSGGGIDGWYKNFYFRSLLELSFLIDMSDKGIDVQTAETTKFKIPYKISGVIKNYFPDFYLPTENIIIEVKPFCRINEPINILKFKAAYKMYDNFKIVSERDFKKITKNKLTELINANIVKLRNKIK